MVLEHKHLLQFLINRAIRSQNIVADFKSGSPAFTVFTAEKVWTSVCRRCISKMLKKKLISQTQGLYSMLHCRCTEAVLPIWLPVETFSAVCREYPILFLSQCIYTYHYTGILLDPGCFVRAELPGSEVTCGHTWTSVRTRTCAASWLRP